MRAAAENFLARVLNCPKGEWLIDSGIIDLYEFAQTLHYELDLTQSQFLSGVATDPNSDFSFSKISCLTKVK